MRENKVTIFNNAIDLERFRFNPSIRESVRRELGLEGKFVIGHAGRFCIQKNHDFLIDVFAEVYRQRNDAVLVLVGNGELFDEVKAKVHRLGLDNAVVFLGVRGDVDRLYQAMDVFVLPSRYEGLGIVNIEAQTAGLPCVVSDVVPLEAKMTDQIIFLPLYKNADKWAEWICKYGISDVRSRGREWRETRFDIASEGKNLQYFMRNGRSSMKKIKVLHLELSENTGGIEVFLYNLYSHIDRDQFQFDFITQSDAPAKENEFKDLGGHIIKISSYKHPVRYYRELKTVMERGYDIIHIHKNSAANILPVVIANIVGNATVISHSHNTSPTSGGRISLLLHKVNRGYLYKAIKYHLACSQEAGKWMYGSNKEFHVIPNGIDTKRFAFNQQTRNLYRREVYGR